VKVTFCPKLDGFKEESSAVAAFAPSATVNQNSIAIGLAEVVTPQIGHFKFDSAHCSDLRWR